VFIDHYGLSPRQYSLAFSINAVAFIASSQFTARLGGRFGLRNVVRYALRGYLVTSFGLLAITAAGIDRLDVMMVILFIGFAFMGLIVPTTAVLALDPHGERAGTASALMGTLQFVTGAIVIAITGSFFDGTSFPMIATIAACALIAFLFGLYALRTHPAPAPVPAR
jgi:DHA1 family bicyclomycin/chloramphenicol resistance-like MFS transporter